MLYCCRYTHNNIILVVCVCVCVYTHAHANLRGMKNSENAPVSNPRANKRSASFWHARIYVRDIADGINNQAGGRAYRCNDNDDNI